MKNDNTFYNSCYNDYIADFCELPLQEKKNKVIEELKELIAITNKICIDYHIEPNFLVNKEMIDINGEDNFAESVYAFIEAFKELYASFLDKYIEDNYIDRK